MGRPPTAKTQLEKRNRNIDLMDKFETNPKALTKAQIMELAKKFYDENKKLNDGGFCYICGQHKPKSNFYVNTDPITKTGYSPICKDCAKGIARRRDKNGDDHGVTKESLQLALFYLNKPFLQHLYESSIDESTNKNHATKDPDNYDVYASYIKNISMPQYYGLTWRDSDFMKEKIVYEDEKTAESIMEGREDQDTYRDFLKNKADVKRLLSYDPFEKESIEDQPFLYSQLLGLLDASEDANDDMMRTASCISIVRNFLQQSKIDDSIAKIIMDPKGLEKNSGTIKSLQDSKAKITGMIKDLAAESCISLKNNKNAKKGENSWTGKIKRIKDMALRDGEVNGFDVNTAKGMQQVADASAKAIIKQLKLDESEYSDILAEQRIIIDHLQKRNVNLEEICRILLRENFDLKDVLEEQGVTMEYEDIDRLIFDVDYFDKKEES